jgi:ribosomal protein S18 acetylase RimI-like enzyme
MNTLVRRADLNAAQTIAALHINFGRMLLTRVTKRLGSLGYASAVLWVLESNVRARRFYEIAGWNPDGRTKVEMLPEGIEFRKVSYYTQLGQQNEES